MPVTLVPPGPGRFALALTVGADVLATQNDEPSLMAFGTPILSAPAGVPTSRMSCTIVQARVHTPGDGQFVEFEQPRPLFAPPTQ